MSETRRARVHVTEDARVGMNVLYAGTYTVEMPADYDPALVTGEDILADGQIRIVERSYLRAGRAEG